MKPVARLLLVFVSLILSASFSFAQDDYTIHLKSGTLQPQPISRMTAPSAASVSGKHIFIQFEGPLTESDKQNLTDRGIQLLDYIPNFTWIAKSNQGITQADIEATDIRWFGQIAPQQKLSSLITDGIGEFARRGGDKVQFVVVLQSDEDPTVWAERFKLQYDANIIGIERSANVIDLIVSESAYSLLAETDEVLWIETAKPEPQEENNSSRDNIGATTLQAAPHNLNGLGIMVAEWDGGFAYSGHSDLTGRVTLLGSASIRDHATHVAGTILGDGTGSSGSYRGMAPAAELLSQLWWSSSSEAATEYNEVIAYGARIASNSWGYGVGDPATQSACVSMMGNYFSENTTLDNIVRGSAGQPMNIVWSAGNERSSSSQYCGSLGWTYNTIGALATAKNVITVGAINSNNNTMTSFSSWGPTDDGRVKPDVVGPGCQSSSDYGVTSCKSTGGYTVMCGTSMSAPAVSGVLALMMQKRRAVFGMNNDVLPSTMKGILINTASDLGTAGPDYSNGHGRVDAVKACSKIGIGAPSYAEGTVSTSTVNQYDLTIPVGTTNLKATLVWDDPGGTAIAGKDLKNDLDLVLVDPLGVEQYAWVLNPSTPSAAATKGLNRRDNVETAEVANPTPGLWKARVVGYEVPTSPQKYSIVFTPDSISTPGQMRAWAVYDSPDASFPPGQLSSVQFWVSNVGGQPDSARVTVTDSIAWISTPLDTVVHLGQFDSVLIVAPLTVPAGSNAGVSENVTCRARSLTDTLITSANAIKVSASAVYVVHLTTQADTITGCPQSFNYSIQVQNSSNASNSITVTPSNSTGWSITPTTRVLNLGIGASGSADFTLDIPADVPHLSTCLLSAIGMGSGSIGDTAQFVVTIVNPIPAPLLVAPDTTIYTRARIHDFNWTGTADSFRLTIASDQGLANPYISYGGITANSLTMPAVDSLPDGLYYWGVCKYVGTDSSTYQEFARTIYVDNITPPSPSHLSPSNNAIRTLKSVTLQYSWPVQPSPLESPEFTRVRLANDTGFTTNLKIYEPVTVTPFAVPDTLAEGRWYWQVQRVDLAGNISQPEVTPSFLVDTKAPEMAVEVSPLDSASLSQSPVWIRWTTGTPPPYETSKEYYYVHISKNAAFTDYSYTGLVYADSFSVDTPLLVDGQRYWWRIKVLDSAGYFTPFSSGHNFYYENFVCGDVNMSKGIPDLSDLSHLVAYLTNVPMTPPPYQSASTDCNAFINLTDLSTLVSYLTGGGATLCCPD